MYKLKTIILSGLIGVSIISNCFAGEEENLNYGEITEENEQEDEEAAMYDEIANDANKAVAIADDNLDSHENEE